jgi:PEGA domain-containing protein
MRVLAITCAIAIAARPAAADRTGVIALGDRDVATAMTAASGALPDALGDARAAIAGGAVPVATLERFRHVRDQIDEAWRAYLRVQLDFAQSRLAAARTAAESLVALPGGEALYADAALRLGAVLGHAGRAAESQAILALALALDPDRPITLAEFSPDIVDAVDAVRAQLTAPRQTRELAITTEPPGAELTVDGKSAGRSPARLPLAVGQHVVIARMPLFHPHAQAFAVDDTTGPLALALDRDDDWTSLAVGAEAGMSDTATLALTEATVRYGDLDALVLVAETDRRGGPTLLVQRCAGIPARCTAIVEIGYADRAGLPAAARDAWSAVRTADLRYPPSLFGDARITGARIAHHCEVCRSPWLWGGVGIVAVVATAAIIAVATASKPPPTVSVNPGGF